MISLDPSFSENKQQFVCLHSGWKLNSAYLIDGKFGSFIDPIVAATYVDREFHYSRIGHETANAMVKLIMQDLEKAGFREQLTHLSMSDVEVVGYANPEGRAAKELEHHMESLRFWGNRGNKHHKYHLLLYTPLQYWEAKAKGVQLSSPPPPTTKTSLKKQTKKKKKTTTKKTKSSSSNNNKPVYFYKINCEGDKFEKGVVTQNQMIDLSEGYSKITFLNFKSNEWRICLSGGGEVNQTVNSLMPVKSDQTLNPRGDCMIFSSKQMYPDGS